jgi:ubiquinone/menaquinone biosynthesis C-methylase UbiE
MKLKNCSPEEPAFWEEYARGMQKGPVNKKCMKPDTWDKAAATYDDLDRCPDYRNQVSTIVDILQQKGALDKKNIVMDIACGTGTYAVKMATKCKRVVCLDISNGMLGKLKEKAEKLQLSNIQTILADWHTFNKEERYDMVFVSMTPLLRSADHIQRFLELSRRFLAIVTWAGIRENQLLNELYQEIMGKKLVQKGHNMILPFNYLHSLGYAPHLTFFNGCWERIRPLKTQVENIIWRLELYRKLTPDEKEKVRTKVEALTDREGFISVTTRVRTCLMIIDRKEQEFSCG